MLHFRHYLNIVIPANMPPRDKVFALNHIEMQIGLESQFQSAFLEVTVY